MTQIEKIPQNRANDITVEDVELKGYIVTIAYYLPEWEACKELLVTLADYEQHLEDILALDWSFMHFEGNEYTKDVSGKMTIAEYFVDVDFQDRNKDAVSYLKANIVDYAALPDMFGAMAAICKDVISKFPNDKTY